MGQLHNWTAEHYHGDPCDRPSLSASIATTLVTKSPLHAWTEHPRLGGIRRKATAEMADGTIIHSLVLGGAEIVEIDADNFRTKAARNARDEALSEGKVPIIASKLDEYRAIADRLSTQIRALGFTLDGHNEQPMTWTEPTAFGDVACRGMMDHVKPDEGVILDLKTASTVNPRALQSHCVKFGYDVQQAAYTSGLAKVKPELQGRIDFVFLFCELEPPFSVVPCRPAGTMRELGERRWSRALETWAWCLERDEWPGYADGVVQLEAPVWALANEEEEAA